MTTIRRPAMDRKAELGDLYNLATEQILAGNIFHKRVPPGLISEQHISKCSYHYYSANSLKERLDAVQLDGDSSLSVLSGLLPKEGSAKHLDDVLEDEELLQYSFWQRLITVTRELKTDCPTLLRDNIAIESFGEASHVIVGIEYGANLCISLKGTKTAEETKPGLFYAKLQQLQTALITDTTEQNECILNLFTHQQVFSDIPGGYPEGMLTGGCAAEALRKIKMGICNHEGVAVPVTLLLCGIEDFCSSTGSDLGPAHAYHEIISKYVLKVQAILDESEQQLCRILNFARKAESLRELLSANDLIAVHEFLRKCELELDLLKATLADLVPNVRRGNVLSTEAIVTFDRKFRRSPLCEQTVSKFIADNTAIKNAIEASERLPSRSFNIGGTAEQNESEFVSEKNFAKFFNPLIPLEVSPLNLVVAKFPCPNENCNEGNGEKRIWHCVRCLQVLEYDLSRNFHCRCGQGSISNFGFKCSLANHGSDFSCQTPAILQRALNELRPYEQINILVIGETGIGKTTWINSTACYLMHDSLTAAVEDIKNFVYLIPFEFTRPRVTKLGVEVQRIQIGHSNNEIYKDGQSSTRSPAAYYFKANEKLYCIIDTPGVGDCRGLEADKKNMQNIANFIAKFSKIHLICFLMEPNQTRLTTTFRFCFYELIMQFHRSAVENIVFCFTKASGVGYEVSETVLSLKCLLDDIEEKEGINIVLQQDTIYAFDNIAYRHLATFFKGISSKDETTNQHNTESYTRSRNETMRMLEDARKKQPHCVAESRNIHLARKIITQLARPLMNIGTQLQQTIAQLRDEVDKWTHWKCKNQEDSLEANLKTKITFQHFTIGEYRNSFCRKCTSTHKYRGEARNVIIESDPSLASQDPIVIFWGGNIEMKDGKPWCPKCKFDFNLVRCEKFSNCVYEESIAIDALVMNELAAAKTKSEEIAIIVKLHQDLMDQLESEKKAVIEASAKFAFFLKKNAIAVYNDIAENYLAILLKNEEKERGHSALFERLEAMLREYIDARNTLEESFERASEVDQVMDSTTVLGSAEELKKLKHYGKDIEMLLQGVEQLHQIDWTKTIIVFDPLHPHRNSHPPESHVQLTSGSSHPDIVF